MNGSFEAGRDRQNSLSREHEKIWFLRLLLIFLFASPANVLNTICSKTTIRKIGVIEQEIKHFEIVVDTPYFHSILLSILSFLPVLWLYKVSCVFDENTKNHSSFPNSWFLSLGKQNTMADVARKLYPYHWKIIYLLINYQLILDFLNILNSVWCVLTRKCFCKTWILNLPGGQLSRQFLINSIQWALSARTCDVEEDDSVVQQDQRKRNCRRAQPIVQQWQTQGRSVWKVSWYWVHSDKNSNIRKE